MFKKVEKVEIVENVQKSQKSFFLMKNLFDFDFRFDVFRLRFEIRIDGILLRKFVLEIKRIK